MDSYDLELVASLRAKVDELNQLLKSAYDRGIRMDVQVSGSAWVSRKGPEPFVSVKDICKLLEGIEDEQ